MPISYFVNQEFANAPYTINNYRIRRFDDEHVLIF
jgi:hypothetical protein